MGVGVMKITEIIKRSENESTYRGNKQLGISFVDKKNGKSFECYVAIHLVAISHFSVKEGAKT